MAPPLHTPLQEEALESLKCLGPAVRLPAPVIPSSHPLVNWLQSDDRCMAWALRYASFLGEELHYRFDKYPNVAGIAGYLSSFVDGALALKLGSKSSEPPDYMVYTPSEYMRESPVASYRLYYVTEHVDRPEWTNRMPPSWWACYRRQTLRFDALD
jgi:hypothetical protein